jgi:hypothetical protein
LLITNAEDINDPDSLPPLKFSWSYSFGDEKKTQESNKSNSSKNKKIYF